ncbi:hypothetical protein DUNSADRAFT_10942 [Dunaliella salina]|uniref:RING-type domain-containing protein n=1 Tax=Dunaliella salina TaxID=3046 RepID=A0ABQ7GEF7_DUNSA|nr:hypothetical protein DUNSADRAFT_10942 [Dunaliella salina]|eukprot:KAF5832986.1 hypothetical protein DUNSADRAFT_10942 [Dunaliella salina]
MSSGSDDDEGGAGAGGAFAALAGLGEEDGNEDEWQTVGKESKKKAKQQQKQQQKEKQQQQGSGAAGSSSAAPPSSQVAGPRNSSINSSATITQQQRALKEAALREIKQEPAPRVHPPPQETPPASRTHDPKGRPLGENYYRAFQRCFVNNTTGDVVLRFHKTDIVKIKASGEVVLTSGGYLTLTTMMSMNDALSHVGIKVRSAGGDIRDASTWSILLPDGAGSMAYEDGVVIPSAHTPAERNRASTVARGLQAMQVQMHEVGRPAPSAIGGGAAMRTAGSAGGPATRGVQGNVVGLQHQQQLQQRALSLQQQGVASGAAPHAPTASAGGPPQPQSYAARLAASMVRQQQQQQQAAAAAAAAQQQRAAAGAGAAGDSNATTNGQPAPVQPPQPPPQAGPAEFAARSAQLTADAFLKFLSPHDYVPMQGGDENGGGEDGELGGGLQAVSASLNNLVGDGAIPSLEEDDSLLCVMCMERPQETILIPCSHAVLCALCADCLMGRRAAQQGAVPSGVAGACPICRTEVLEVINVAD